ncbi:MAG: electron transport complex subunit RsxB [Burkholderiaceae bacterium]
MPAVADRILAALPQTQCTRCGYADCAAYTEAIATGAASINQCPPGGSEGISRLATITGQQVVPLNPDNGNLGPRMLAWIDEDWCIGCTLCIEACPTDAIVGSNKRMHTVIERYCTGCELCVPVCPVDCISLENASGSATGWDAWSQPQADLARSRYAIRTERRKTANASVKSGPCPQIAADSPGPMFGDKVETHDVQEDKRAIIATALARSRARRALP